MAFTRVHFQEIASWRQEAWQEEHDRYYFPMREAAEVLKENGEVFVVGRKGTGKSALAQHLLIEGRKRGFSSQLSLREFPYENFRDDLSDPEERSTLKFDLAWQYVAYCEIASLMAKNPNLNWRARDELRQVFSQKSMGAVENIRRWSDPQFWLDLIEAGLKIERGKHQRRYSIREMRDAMRAFVLENIDSCLYLIVFDGLDFGFSNMSADRHAEYTAIISGLCSAVMNIKQDLKNADTSARPALRPVVFLRDDIFRKHVRGSDAEKHIDSKIELKWTPARIKELLAFRIARACGRPDDSKFDTLWVELCGNHPEFGVGSKHWNKFDYIGSFTFGRPRDFVYYIAKSCREALEQTEGKTNPPVISKDVLQKTVADFSRHLRNEIQNEMSGDYPAIDDILDVLEKLNKRVFSAKEFEERYVAAYAELASAEPAGQVLERLFEYGVIGNVAPGGEEYFSYMPSGQSGYRRFEDTLKKSKLVIHKGLVRDLVHA